MKKRETELLSRISKEFPKLSLKSYKYVDCGFDHEVIILKNSIVFRFPKEKVYSDKLNSEISLLNYLKKHLKFKIPRYKYVPKDRSFAGYDFVKGKEFRNHIYEKLSSKEKNSFTKQIASFLTNLHKTPRKILLKYEVPDEDSKKELKEFIKITKKHIFPKLSKKETEKVLKFFLELKRHLKDSYRKVLTHQDLTAEHILWNKKTRKIGIIDFSDRMIGDPAIDFAGLFEYGKTVPSKVLEHYKGTKDKNLISRAELYYKKISLNIMKDALTGHPCTFKEGYKLFRKVF